MMLDEGGGAIETTIFKNKITRMAIDSITSFSLLFDSEKAKRRAVLGFFEIIRKWHCTSLLTVQYNPSDKKDKGLSAFDFESDSITVLYYNKVGIRRQRLLEILKMRGVRHSKEMHVFKIDRGIVVGPPARSKV